MCEITKAVLRGEATLRSIAQQVQQARIIAADALIHDATATEDERIAALHEEQRMRRVERFCWDALSSLPENQVERLRALYDHLDSVSQLSGS